MVSGGMQSSEALPRGDALRVAYAYEQATGWHKKSTPTLIFGRSGMRAG
jgi:hypothetical protein